MVTPGAWAGTPPLPSPMYWKCVARVDVTFLSGQAPIGDMDGPSEAFARDKVEFGSSRIARWFNPRQ